MPQCSPYKYQTQHHFVLSHAGRRCVETEGVAWGVWHRLDRDRAPLVTSPKQYNPQSNITKEWVGPPWFGCRNSIKMPEESRWSLENQLTFTKFTTSFYKKLINVKPEWQHANLWCNCHTDQVESFSVLSLWEPHGKPVRTTRLLGQQKELDAWFKWLMLPPAAESRPSNLWVRTCPPLSVRTENC